jgi:hypothetical protein
VNLPDALPSRDPKSGRVFVLGIPILGFFNKKAKGASRYFT